MVNFQHGAAGGIFSRTLYTLFVLFCAFGAANVHPVEFLTLKKRVRGIIDFFGCCGGRFSLNPKPEGSPRTRKACRMRTGFEKYGQKSCYRVCRLTHFEQRVRTLSAQAASLTRDTLWSTGLAIYTKKHEETEGGK